MPTLEFDLKYAPSDAEALLGEALQARGVELQRGGQPNEWSLHLRAAEIVVQLILRPDGMTHVVLQCASSAAVLAEVMEALTERLEAEARESFPERAETYRERATY